MMKNVAIVMAAGTGSRMGSDIPKQFLTIKGRPVLYFSLKTLEESFIDEIVVVTRKSDIEYVKNEIVDKYGFKKVSAVTEGGKERSDSVFCGLKAVKDDGETYVYIHDGARPLLNMEMLERVKADVLKYGAVVAAVPSKDTVKLADEDGFVSVTPERSRVWSVQTPQAFEYRLIYEAFLKMNAEGNVKVTDDGQVMELFSDTKVFLTMGDYRNIKITTPEDLELAEKFLENL